MVKSAPPPSPSPGPVPGQCTLLNKSGVGDLLNSQFIGRKTAPCGGTTGVSCDFNKGFGGIGFRTFDFENSFTFWAAAGYRPYAATDGEAIMGKQTWGPLSVWMQNIISAVYVNPTMCGNFPGFPGGFVPADAPGGGVIGVVMNVDSANKAETGTDFGCVFPSDGKTAWPYVRGAPDMSLTGPLKDRVAFFKTGDEAVNPASPAFAVPPIPGAKQLNLACGSCDCENKSAPGSDCAYAYNDFCTGLKSGKDKKGAFVGSFCVPGDLNVPKPPADLLNGGISCAFMKGSDPQGMFDKSWVMTKNFGGTGNYNEIPIQQVQGSRSKSIKAFMASSSLVGAGVKPNEYKFRIMQQCSWWNRLQKTNVPLLTYDKSRCTDGPQGLCGPFTEEMECFKDGQGLPDGNADGKGLPSGDSYARIEVLESVFSGMWGDKPSLYKCIPSTEDPKDASKESLFKAGSVKVQVKTCGLTPGTQFDLNTQRWIFKEVGTKTGLIGTIPFGNIKLDGKWCLTYTDDGTPDDGDDFTAEECLDDQKLKDLKKTQHWLLDADFGAIITTGSSTSIGALDFGPLAKAITVKGGLLELQPATNGALSESNKVVYGVSDPKTGYKMYENQRFYGGMFSRHSWNYR